ncbi:MAG: peptidase M1, partial [Bacteroidia bacterium]|nr:peptidase M1 [Bacteroidia bacterium]
YGHSMAPYLWTKFYWLLFGLLILMLASLIAARGVDVKLMHRLKKVRSKLSRNTKILVGVILIPFVLIGAFIFYQTNVLNEVWTEQEEQEYRANYEKTLKQFEFIPQPKIIEANLHLELYPDERSYDLVGAYTLKNEEEFGISEIHIQKLIESDIRLESVLFSDSVTIDDQYQTFEYIIYKLADPLEAGESITMEFKQLLEPKGFNSSGSIGPVLENGTFIRNNEFPTIGYNRKYELTDTVVREGYGLDPRPGKAALDNINELKLARTGSDSHGVRMNITIGTDHDQTALTSGKLVNKRVEGNRNYFEYHSTEPMINFYAMLSGRYKVRKEKWHPENRIDKDTVELEIYYHPRHIINLDRMINGMKASLDYYSTNFSPYQYDQLRIVEFPRYQEFAQSFPNTIPFSESIGFMLDIDDAFDVDITFFITAHEVAHQWWGMQLETANVKGRNLVLETLSQYSALMVFKHQFSQAKVDQFLALQQDLYDDGKKKAKVEEASLHLVENEEHIYYNKGVIAMNKLQEYIGEDKVNQALKSFINDWNNKNGLIKTKTDIYPTSEDLIMYILKFTPESKKNLVLKLFKAI